MTGDKHTAREVAQVLEGHGTVVGVDVVTNGDRSCIEATLATKHIPPGVLTTLGKWGFSIDTDATATRGYPLTATVVAYEVSDG